MMKQTHNNSCFTNTVVSTDIEINNATRFTSPGWCAPFFTSHKKTPIRLGLLTLFVTVFSFSGCSCSEDDDACRSDNDCNDNHLCINNRCVFDVSSGITDSDSDDSESDSTHSSDDSDFNSDSNDSDSDSDSGEVCVHSGSGTNGAECDNNCDCASLHCQNGFCCDEGECCGDAADCAADLCASAACLESRCEYIAIPYACGTTDAVGESCTGTSVCDGEQNCIPLSTADCGLYATTGIVSCDGETATETCYDACTTTNESTHCVNGAACVNGSCVSYFAAENGSACEDDADCISGHCGDGYCCAAGECCAADVDCSDNCRTNVQCGSNNQCFSVNLACGYEDDAGVDTCQDTQRCNGLGACVAMVTCEDQGSYFGADGSYVCDADSVQQGCLDACTSNTQCAPGSQCVDDVCLLSNGASCGNAAECASGYCNNGACCDSGVCCIENSDCDVPCQSGETCNADTFQCEAGTATECGSQENSCTSDNRCDGAGNCVTVTDYCIDNGADTYACSNGEILRDCRCNEDADCDLDDTFCNGTYACGVNGVCDFNLQVSACDEETACYTDVSCDEVSRSCSGTNPCDDLATECDSKRCIADSNDGYSCAPNPVADAVACDDGNLCNGIDDICLDGVCEPGPPNTAYCFDDDPCTIDECTENDTDAPNCTHTAVSLGSACGGEYNCFGDSGICELNPSTAKVECVPLNVPCDNNGICLSHQCDENFAEDTVSCSDTPNLSYIEINCGEQITIDADDFSSRVYTDYSGAADLDSDSANDCEADDGNPFIGKEAVLYIQPDPPGEYTADLEIVDIVPADYGVLDFILFQEADICDWTTCTGRQENGYLDLALSADSLNPEIIIDTRVSYWPPQSVTLQLTCN